MPNRLRLLMVEDSEDDAALIARHLSRGGYDVVTKRVDSAEALRTAVDRAEWDLVICDFSMPHFSGMDALKLLRGRGLETPFIFVSGTIGEDTAVSALKMGAQDYLMKDNLSRLLSAVERELREVERKKEKLFLTEEIDKLQKFEAIGRLAGGIAHDFNNVLGVIIGWANIGHEESPPDSKLRQRFAIIEEQGRRAAGLTKQLLAFARQQVLERRNLSLNELLGGTSALIGTVLSEQIELKLSLADDLAVIYADPTQIDQVILNLCINARDAMPRGGTLSITTSNVEISESMIGHSSSAKPGKFVLCAVADTGTGMDSATMQKIFEPFFTTKEVGRGTGLGLSTVYGIVKQHNGFITVESVVDHGTTFRVYLPSGFGKMETAVLAASTARGRGSELILVAEDHEALRELAVETLGGDGYAVIVAANGEEALRLFAQRSSEISLVILDVVMPGLCGPDAYGEMCKNNPDLPVIFTTGHSMELAELHERIEKGAKFLQKPYMPQALGQAVREVLDGKVKARIS
jgi:signal transduction histidine kinase